MKQLIVNADDFGFTHDVNRGIAEAHTRGILTATTLMANGAAFDDAVRLAREHPRLDIGVHLVLVGGLSLVTGEPLPATVPALVQAMCLRRIGVYDELKRQVERVMNAGIRPTHLDSHKHTHLLPPVLDAAARLASEYGIRWVRRPFDLPLSGDVSSVPWGKRAISRSAGGLRARFHAHLSRYGCRTTDHFAGFQLTGYLRSPEIIALLRSLPEGLTEFMCHPGRCTEELRATRTRLKESRERELEALTDPAVRRAINEHGIVLRGYSTRDSSE